MMKLPGYLPDPPYLTFGGPPNLFCVTAGAPATGPGAPTLGIPTPFGTEVLMAVIVSCEVKTRDY